MYIFVNRYLRECRRLEGDLPLLQFTVDGPAPIFATTDLIGNQETSLEKKLHAKGKEKRAEIRRENATDERTTRNVRWRISFKKFSPEKRKRYALSPLFVPFACIFALPSDVLLCSVPVLTTVSKY